MRWCTRKQPCPRYARSSAVCSELLNPIALSAGTWLLDSLECGKSLRHDLIHVVVLIRRKPTDECTSGFTSRQRSYSLKSAGFSARGTG